MATPCTWLPRPQQPSPTVSIDLEPGLLPCCQGHEPTRAPRRSRWVTPAGVLEEVEGGQVALLQLVPCTGGGLEAAGPVPRP